MRYHNMHELPSYKVPIKLGADYLEQVGLFYRVGLAKQVDYEIEVTCTKKSSNVE